MRLLYITTDPIALRVLMEGQLAYFREQGYEVIAVASPGRDLDVVAERDHIQIVGVQMHREIRLGADLLSLWQMWRLIRRLRPDIVCTATSKASLLGMVASWLARVPVRVYRLWGLRLETAHGVKRRILAAAEWLTAACSHRVLSISQSLMLAFVAARLCKPHKICVVGNGSNGGIQAELFMQTPDVRANAQKIRSQWGMPGEAPVIGFVGRFVRDKGIVELVDAFESILAARPDSWLLLVGDYEAGDPVPEDYVHRITEHPRIVRAGFVPHHSLSAYYGAMTVFAFPTHREGFGNVAVEAGAAELPVVTFNSTGAVDAVQNGVTGTVVPVGDTKALANAILRYLNDNDLRRKHGLAGRRRAETDFRPEPIWKEMDAHFRELLDRNGRAQPVERTAKTSQPPVNPKVNCLDRKVRL